MSYLRYHFPEGVCAFSTCRDGGVGQGAYATFNCTHYCGDDESSVAVNRNRLCADLHIAPDRLFIPRQVHDTLIAEIDEQFLSLPVKQQQARLEGIDALTTCQPDCCIAVSTADCIPILLYDTRTRAMAAIHAGWRGTVARILTFTLQRMRTRYGTRAKELMAVIGPGISLEAFEVGDEVYHAFSEAGFPMRQVACRKEKWHIDLWEANRLLLLEAGVPESQIEVAGICTYGRCDLFFSARRLGIKSGRMLTGIMRTE